MAVSYDFDWSASAGSVDITIRSVEVRANPDKPLPSGGLIGTTSCW